MATPKQRKRNKRQLQAILRGLGVKPGPFGKIIDVAIRRNWTSEELVSRIYRTKAFRRMFPGIKRPDGSLRMSPSEYRHISDVYKSIGRNYGIRGLTKKQIGRLIGGNVSMQEFNDRMLAVQRVRQNASTLAEFREVLKSRGIATKGLESQADFVRFVLGRGPKQFYDLYSEFNVGSAARGAGLQDVLSQD